MAVHNTAKECEQQLNLIEQDPNIAPDYRMFTKYCIPVRK